MTCYKRQNISYITHTHPLPFTKEEKNAWDTGLRCSPLSNLKFDPPFHFNSQQFFSHPRTLACPKWPVARSLEEVLPVSLNLGNLFVAIPKEYHILNKYNSNCITKYENLKREYKNKLFVGMEKACAKKANWYSDNWVTYRFQRIAFPAGSVFKTYDSHFLARCTMLNEKRLL